MTFWHKKRSARIFGKEIRPKVFGKKSPDKFGKTTGSPRKTAAQPKINLQSFKSTPESLKQRFN